MKEHERPLVHGSPTRCPYCHEEAAPEESVACATCLARHHAGCWDEGGRCATCGAGQRLTPEPLPPLTAERAERLLVEAGYSTDVVHGFLARPMPRACPRERAPTRSSPVAFLITALAVPVAALLGLIPEDTIPFVVIVATLVAIAQGLLRRSYRGAVGGSLLVWWVAVLFTAAPVRVPPGILVMTITAWALGNAIPGLVAAWWARRRARREAEAGSPEAESAPANPRSH